MTTDNDVEDAPLGATFDLGPSLPVTIHDKQTGKDTVYNVVADIDPVSRVRLLRWFRTYRIWRNQQMPDPDIEVDPNEKPVEAPKYDELYLIVATCLEIPLSKAKSFGPTPCMRIADFLLGQLIVATPTENSSE